MLLEGVRKLRVYDLVAGWRLACRPVYVGGRRNQFEALFPG